MPVDAISLKHQRPNYWFLKKKKKKKNFCHFFPFGYIYICVCVCVCGGEWGVKQKDLRNLRFILFYVFFGVMYSA